MNYRTILRFVGTRNDSNGVTVRVELGEMLLMSSDDFDVAMNVKRMWIDGGTPLLSPGQHDVYRAMLETYAHFEPRVEVATIADN